jgi:hypothetical protein
MLLSSDYVNNYEDAVELLSQLMENPLFSNFIIRCERSPECKSQEIGDFLILPVQVKKKKKRKVGD